jgi:TolA-binding protein
MPLTSLEIIAEKLAEVKSQELEDILKISGSAASAKNEYGVTVVDDTNSASSLLFKRLNKPKYDDIELVKAIDVDVKELKPNIPTKNLNLVPKPLYDEQIVLVEDLRKQVKTLSLTIDDLNSQITTLQSQVQTEINNRLSIEQTNDALANQIDTLTNTIGDFTGQISISLQKSVDESILRASLQSQNTGFQAQIKALIKQIDSLNSIIEGLQSQLGAVQQQQAIQQSSANVALASGADVLAKVVLLKIDGPAGLPNEETGIKLRGNGKSGSNDVRWVQGGKLKFTNNDKSEVSITINHTKPTGLGGNPDWLIIPEATFKIAASGTKDVELKIDHNGGNGIDSKPGRFWGHSHSTAYYGNMKVTVTTIDGTTDSKEYKTKFGKMHPDSF